MVDDEELKKFGITPGKIGSGISARKIFSIGRAQPLSKDEASRYIEIIKELFAQPETPWLNARILEFEKMIEASDAELLANGTTVAPEGSDALKTYDTPLWYALEIVRRFNHIADLTEKSDAQGAAREGIKLGLALKEYDLKKRWDLFAVHGKRIDEKRNRFDSVEVVGAYREACRRSGVFSKEQAYKASGYSKSTVIRAFNKTTGSLPPSPKDVSV